MPTAGSVEGTLAEIFPDGSGGTAVVTGGQVPPVTDLTALGIVLTKAAVKRGRLTAAGVSQIREVIRSQLARTHWESPPPPSGTRTVTRVPGVLDRLPQDVLTAGGARHAQVGTPVPTRSPGLHRRDQVDRPARRSRRRWLAGATRGRGADGNHLR